MGYDMEFKIEQHVGVLSKNSRSGWRKELTLTSWNGKPAKLEIRDWNEDYTRCGKGMTFTEEESLALRELMSQLEI